MNKIAGLTTRKRTNSLSAIEPSILHKPCASVSQRLQRIDRNTAPAYQRSVIRKAWRIKPLSSIPRTAIRFSKFGMTEDERASYQHIVPFVRTLDHRPWVYPRRNCIWPEVVCMVWSRSARDRTIYVAGIICDSYWERHSIVIKWVFHGDAWPHASGLECMDAAVAILVYREQLHKIFIPSVCIYVATSWHLPTTRTTVQDNAEPSLNF